LSAGRNASWTKKRRRGRRAISKKEGLRMRRQGPSRGSPLITKSGRGTENEAPPSERRRKGSKINLEKTAIFQGDWPQKIGRGQK